MEYATKVVRAGLGQLLHIYFTLYTQLLLPTRK